MYKRLFKIKHNGKEFYVFVNEKHRYAFMQIKDNKLVYPDIDDFIYLFNAFNVNHGIVTSPLIGEKLPERFEEKVNVKGLLLSIIYALSLTLPSIAAYDVKVKNGAVYVSNNSGITERLFTSIQFNSVSELNAYLGYRSISKEEVFEAIDNNKNFNPKQREIAKSVLAGKIEVNPDIDLRLIYENMLTLNIVDKTVDELKDKYKETMSGCYDMIENTIYLSDHNDGLFAHEISHAMHFYYRADSNKLLYIGAGDSSLHECIANMEGEQGLKEDIPSYVDKNTEDSIVLDFFLEHTDKFNFKVYDEYGINPLIDELKEKYPDVDIDYIIDFFNANHSAQVQLKPQYTSMFENEYLLDQLYEIVALSINEDNSLEQLRSLARVLKYNNEYFNKYLELLFEKELISEDIYNLVYNLNNGLDHLTFVNNTFYLGTKDNKCFIDSKLVDESSDCLVVPIPSSVRTSIIDDYLQGIDKFDENYINELIKNNNIINEDLANAIKDYDEDKIKAIVDKIFYTMLNNCSSIDEAIEQYKSFDDAYLNTFILSGNYIRVLRESYMLYYDKLIDVCLNNGFIGEREANLLHDFSGIIELNDQYYLASSFKSAVDNHEVYNYLCDDYHKETDLVVSDLSTFSYLDENGKVREKDISRNDGVFTKYTLNKNGELKLLKYLSENPLNNVSQEYIENMLNACNIDEKELHKNVFTLTTGEVLYDGELDDSIFIVFGKDEEGNITYQISKDGTIIYTSCDNFIPLSSRISYKMFLSRIQFTEANYLDELLNDKERIVLGLNSLESIMPEATFRWTETEKKLPISHKVGNTVTYTTKTEWELEVDFSNPIIINLEGQNCYARSISASSDYHDGYIYINYPDGSREKLAKISDANFLDEYIFEFLDDYIRKYNINPSEDGIIYLTKDQIREFYMQEYSELINNYEQNKAMGR